MRFRRRRTTMRRPTWANPQSVLKAELWHCCAGRPTDVYEQPKGTVTAGETLRWGDALIYAARYAAPKFQRSTAGNSWLLHGPVDGQGGRYHTMERSYQQKSWGTSCILGITWSGMTVGTSVLCSNARAYLPSTSQSTAYNVEVLCCFCARRMFL